MQKKYFNFLHIDPDQWIKMYFKIAHRREDVNSVLKAAELLELDRKSLVKMQARRFGYTIEFPAKEEKKPHGRARLNKLQDNFFHSGDILGLMRSYLSGDDEARLNNVSRFLHDNGTLLLLSKIKSFQLALQEEIEEKPFSEERDVCCPVSVASVLLLFVVVMAVSAHYLRISNSSMHQIYDEMGAINTTNGTPCSDLIVGRFCNSDSPQTYESPCNSYCDRLDNQFGANLGSFFGVIIGSLLTTAALGTLIGTLLANCRGNLFRGQERFDDIQLNNFSGNLRYKATRLFAEFKEDPEFKLTEHSTIRTIKTTLNEYVSRLNTRSQTHNLFKREAARVERDDDVILEIKQEVRY